MSTMNEHVSLVVEGTEHEVVALEGREALSELFVFELVCVQSGDAGARQLLGGAATIVFRSAGMERTVHGIVAVAERRPRDDGTVELALSVRPAAYRLTLGRMCRTFHDATVVDVVDRVLADVPHRWELSEDYQAREYWAQYRQDDWTWICGLLERAGIYFWFDHDDGSTLVLSDTSTAAPELGGLLAYAPASDLSARRETVEELASEAVATATRFTVGSFDPAHPRLPLSATTGEDGIECYDAPGAGPRTPEACARRATILHEAAQAARHGVAGTSSSARLCPGRVAVIAGHPFARLDGRYLITEASHRVVQRRRGDAAGETAYLCRFRALPAAMTYRPPERAPEPQQAGLQSGVVVGAAGEEIDPDGTGRVRVKLHWDRDGARDRSAGRWMRVAQRGTADSMLLPRIGWNVLTFNEEGSVDDPDVLSRIHDAEHPPAYPLPDNKTRVVFKTATSPGDGSFNEIRYEDQKGSEEMFMHASRDMNVLVQNEKTEQVVRDFQHRVNNDHDLGVGASFSEHVEGDQRVSIAGDETLSVVGSRNKEIGGNESETIGKSRSLHVGTVHQNMVQQTRRVRVGAVQVDTCLGPIASASGTTTHVLVGGAAVRASAKSISESVTLASAQTIGGAKLEIARGKRNIEAKRLHKETVGGAMVLSTAKALTNETSIATTLSVGGWMSWSAPTLTIEGKERIVLVCGATSITITAASVVIRTPKLTVPKAGSDLLEAVAPRIDHD